MKLYERIENNNFDEIDRNRAIELIKGGNGHLVYNENYFKLQKENEEIRIKNNAIKRESEAYLEHMIRLDNELNLEKEKSKYEWIRQNCLSQELVNKLYIPIQKVKDKIKKEIKYHEKNILDIEKQDYFEKYRYHLQQNESLTKEFSNVIPVQKVKDKIEEILKNKEYRIVFEGNAEVPDDATIINAQKYIKLEKMQELIEERKVK